MEREADKEGVGDIVKNREREIVTKGIGRKRERYKEKGKEQGREMTV